MKKFNLVGYKKANGSAKKILTAAAKNWLIKSFVDQQRLFFADFDPNLPNKLTVK